jgi:hypothetical protein
LAAFDCPEVERACVAECGSAGLDGEDWLGLPRALEGFVSSRGRLGGSSLDFDCSSLNFRFRGSADTDFLISAESPFLDTEGAGRWGSTDCALDESETGYFGGRLLATFGLDDEDLILETSEDSRPSWRGFWSGEYPVMLDRRLFGRLRDRSEKSDLRGRRCRSSVFGLRGRGATGPSSERISVSASDSSWPLVRGDEETACGLRSRGLWADGEPGLCGRREADEGLDDEGFSRADLWDAEEWAPALDLCDRRGEGEAATAVEGDLAAPFIIKHDAAG